MIQSDITRLHQFLLAHYNLDELKTLCVNLSVEYDDLGGEGRAGKARELALFMQRHGRLIDLKAVLAQQHEEAYRAAFSEAPPPPAVTAELPRRQRRRYERNPRQVFVSHATADAEFAHRLADDLRREGYTIWIAPESIRPGEKWVEAIDRGLETSGIFIVVLTPQAVSSKWVKTETNAAIDLTHQDKIRFISLDVAECHMPILWRQFQHIAFRKSYEIGLDELLRWLIGESNISASSHDDIAAYVHWLDSLPDKVYPPSSISVSDPINSNIRIHEKTGIELIRIPAGPFLYGSSDADEMARENEKPQRMINLPEYWIGRAPVTNAQYKCFLDANPEYPVPFSHARWAKPNNWSRKSRTYPGGKADHPVVMVSWEDARAYCDWAGLTLPSGEQWEKAARGTDGRLWPWGNEAPTAKHCNYKGNVGDTTPVAQYSPKGDGPYGCVDMAGNVLEWMASWYTEDKARALRGSSWDYFDRYTRIAYRFDQYPILRSDGIGFRVAELLSGAKS